MSHGGRPLSGGASITVEMALRLPSLRRGAPRVVAGDGNLGRRIRWAHSSEVPDIARLLKGGELLLMTGMGVGRAAGDQRAFVRALAERDVAGVVIELGQVFDRLPAPIVAEARAHGVPLVELHREVPFVEVTEEIHSSIVSRQLAILRRGDELHGRFTALMLEGAGISEILAVLASTIANPVVLEKAQQGVLYHATHHAPAADVLDAFERACEDRELPAGTVAREIPAAGGHAWGRLVALPLDSPLDEFDQVAVERAVALVALALLRGRQETLLATRERGNFLADVADGRIPATEAEARAAALGFEARRSELLPIAVIAAPRAITDGRQPDEAEWTAVWRALRERLQALSLPVLIGSRGAVGDTLVLLSIPDASRRCAAVEQTVDALRSAIARHLGPPELAVVAAGAAVARWEQLPAALRQAAEVARLARDRPPRRWHDATIPDLDRLLWSMRDEPRLREFAERRLAGLIEHDSRRSSKLMPTLEALCGHGWRKAETARALHLNRQSLYPRLERLAHVLGCDLDDSETRLGLELAVRAWRQDPAQPARRSVSR